MTETFACPHCQIQLRLTPEMAGKTLRCPGCQATFTAGAPAPPPPPPARGRDAVAERRAPEPPPGPPAYRQSDEDYGAPPRRRRGRESERDFDYVEEPKVQLSGEEIEAWRSAESGFTLHLLAHYLYLGGIGVYFLMTLIVPFLSGPSRGAGVVITIFAILGLLLLLSNWILATVSTCFWLLAPARQGAKAVGIACLVLSSLVLLRTASLFELSEFFLERGHGPERPFLAAFSGLISFLLLEISRLTMFPFFLRAVASNFKSAGLRSMVLFLAIATPSTFVFLFLFNFLLGLAGGGVAVVIIRNVITNLCYLGLLVWGVFILLRGRSILRSQLSRAAG